VSSLTPFNERLRELCAKTRFYFAKYAMRRETGCMGEKCSEANDQPFYQMPLQWGIVPTTEVEIGLSPDTRFLATKGLKIRSEAGVLGAF